MCSVILCWNGVPERVGGGVDGVDGVLGLLLLSARAPQSGTEESEGAAGEEEERGKGGRPGGEHERGEAVVSLVHQHSCSAVQYTVHSRNTGSVVIN